MGPDEKTSDSGLAGTEICACGHVRLCHWQAGDVTSCHLSGCTCKAFVAAAGEDVAIIGIRTDALGHAEVFAPAGRICLLDSIRVPQSVREGDAQIQISRDGTDVFIRPMPLALLEEMKPTEVSLLACKGGDELSVAITPAQSIALAFVFLVYP
jgi:hypothetical protein